MKLLKNQLLLLLAFCFSLCLSSNSYAKDLSYNYITFFGDSLSDNGNLYKAMMGFLPKSPPYYEGRFSNGPTWAEHVADHYAQTNQMDFSNYAVGSETAIFHNPAGGYLPYTLSMSVSNYLWRWVFNDKSQTLFVIWIGANDYLQGSSAIDEDTSAVVDGIAENVEKLISYGGTNFLVVNLPDLSKTPWGKESGFPDVLSTLTIEHNTKLASKVASLKSHYPTVNIQLFDLYSVFQQMLIDPKEYNDKYGSNISNLADSCWLGGYTLRKNNPGADRAALVKEINDYMSSKKKGSRANAEAAQAIDANQLANAIMSSPSLASAYQVGKSAKRGDEPCAEPESYVFWDKVHPTNAVHTVLSKMFVEFIDENYH